MGRQLYFYMTEQDEREFIDHLRLRSDPCILLSRSDKPEPALLSALPGPDVPGWFTVWLWDRKRLPAAQAQACSRAARLRC